MTTEKNTMILEDYLIDEDIEYQLKDGLYFIKVNLKEAKLPHAVIFAYCLDNLISFNIFAERYVVPVNKIDQISEYFRIINSFLEWGDFRFINEKLRLLDNPAPLNGLSPAYRIVVDTIDRVPSKDRIRCVINYLGKIYERYIDGVLMIQYDILNPLQAAKVFTEKE